jgi:hypothetical protein
MPDSPVSRPVIALAAAARVLLVFGFSRWRVRHRDASAPSRSRKRPGSPSARARCAPAVGALLAKHPVNPSAYFISCWQDLLVHGLLISLVHRMWIALPKVTALRKRDGPRICQLFPLQHTGLPWFCTSCPQGRAQRKPAAKRTEQLGGYGARSTGLRPEGLALPAMSTESWQASRPCSERAGRALAPHP